MPETTVYWRLYAGSWKAWILLRGSAMNQTSATYTWPAVYSNWHPDYYYPYNVFRRDAFELSSIQQQHAAYIQPYSWQAAILAVASDSEGIGAF